MQREWFVYSTKLMLAPRRPVALISLEAIAHIEIMAVVMVVARLVVAVAEVVSPSRPTWIS